MASELNSRTRILVSHFPDETARFISGTLHQEGYQIHSLKNGSDFKKTLEQESFNLIILDSSRSEVGDEDLISFVKQQYPATLVLVISNDNTLEGAIECIRRGAYDYLTTPLEKASLLKIVERSLHRQRMGFKRKEITRSLEEKVVHLQQLNQRMATLYKIIRDTRGLPTLEDSIHKVLEYLGEAIDQDCSVCVLFDEQCEKVILHHKHGRESDLGTRLMKILLSPTERIRKSFLKGAGLTEISQEVEKELLQQGIQHEELRNFIVCPLIILKNLYGYLCLINPERPPYTFADRQMLSIVASQAVAICEENHSLLQSSQLITMGSLTSELAHDIKQPIATIKGILQTLDGKWQQDSAREEALQMIQEELSRADNLAVELLSFAKTQQLEISYWNIHDLLRKAMMITKNTLTKASIKVEENYHSEPLMIWANDNELIDAFVNIIVNAYQAMPEGGTISIATRLYFHQGIVSKGSPSRGRFVQVEFTDTGIGMTPWEMDRIFERFYTTKQTGTGLGLSIVDRVVKKYQGFIDVKSVKDQGTSFYINLPQR